MPVAAAFIRIFAALLLSIPLFFAASYYLAASAAEETVLDTEFVASTFEESALYQRIYGEVFLQEQFSGWTTSLIGGLEASDDDQERLLQEVLPPGYIQGETERNVAQLTGYLQGQDDELDLFIDLNTPLENARPTALAYLDQQIGALDSRAVSSEEQLSTEIATFLDSVADGQIPSNIPSAETLSPEQRVAGYQEAITTLDQSQAVPPTVIADLEAQEPEILPAARGDNWSLALRLAGRVAAGPHVEDAIASVRRKSDAQGRFDLIAQLAANSERTSGEVRRDAGILRFLVQAGTGPAAQWTALAIAVLCLVLMAAIFIPYWNHVLFWPSILLFAFGVLLLFTALSASWDSTYWSAAICNGAVQNSCRLSVDIGRNIASGVAAMFIDRALQIIIIGLAGILASLVVSRIVGRRAR